MCFHLGDLSVDVDLKIISSAAKQFFLVIPDMHFFPPRVGDCFILVFHFFPPNRIDFYPIHNPLPARELNFSGVKSTVSGFRIARLPFPPHAEPNILNAD